MPQVLTVFVVVGKNELVSELQVSIEKEET